MEVLFESARVRAVRVPHPSPTLLVTFANYEGAPAKDAIGFGRAFFDAIGVDAIHVTGAGNDWFQYAEMAALCRVVQAAGAGKRVIAYGSSMGGYAALRFAAAIGADLSVAISPQYAIARGEVPWERRWRAEARRIRFLPWREPSGPPPALLFFDPHNPDARHAALWAGTREVTLLPLPHAGHPATTFLAEAGLLGDTLRAIVGNAFDRAALLAAARRRRGRSAAYLSRLAAVQPGWRRRTALALAAQAAAIGGSTEYHGRQGVLLYRAGQDAAAEAAHRKALALDDTEPLAHFRLSRFLQRTGRYAEALDAAEAAYELDPAPALRRHRRALLNATARTPRPGRLWARLHNRLIHRLNRIGWRRGWPMWDRLLRP